MACTSYRGIDERLEWMDAHPPGEPGWCAREVWQALGGDKNPPCPPAWGAANANEVYDKVVNSGRYWTSTPIPRGAIIVWKYGNNGHVAYSYSDGKILTTDPEGQSGGVGVENLSYPEKWGASPSKRIWTDQYNGVRFDVAASIDHGPVYLDKLHYGQKDSDSVKRLQMHLNGHSLEPPGHITLDISGNYLDNTDTVVRADQDQHGYGNDPAQHSSVGPQQAAHLFTGCDCEIIEAEEPTEPPVEPPSTDGKMLKMKKWYSDKPGGTYTLPSDGNWHKLDDMLDEPDLGITTDSSEERFLYLRVELDKTRSANKLLEIKFERKNGDETAMDSKEFSLIKDSYPYRNFHIEDGPGDGGTWWAKCTGGTSPMKFTTRYSKLHVFYEAE